MGPVLLCDKSTIQSLHQTAPDALNDFFILAVPSILVFEILGDLTKEGKSGGPSMTRELARRIGGMSTIPIVEFPHLIASELNGHKIKMDHRPQVATKKIIQGEEGKFGIEIAEDPSEAMLLRWRVGDFSDFDLAVSEVWRKRKSELDWRKAISTLKDHIPISVRPKRTREEIEEYVDDLITCYPKELREWFLKEFEVLGNRDRPDGREGISGDTYLIFCIRVTLFSLLSMNFQITSTKADNFLDLEYLFYLPFTNAFVARDRFSKFVAASFVRENQCVVDHDDLAADLKRIADEGVRGSSKGPPVRNDSVCHQLWQKFMKPGYADTPKLKLSVEQEKRIVEDLRKWMNGKEISGETVDSDSAHFTFRRRTILATDPCPCKSGLAFRDCHGLKK